MTIDVGISLAIAAASVGALHSLAPDHWLPIAAVSRARGWSTLRTARVAFLCGFGHVTVSVLLGIAGLLGGREVVATVGARASSVSAMMLIGFGLTYAAWGWRQVGRRGPRDPARTGVWALFAIYCADPCIAVIPILFAAATTSTAVTVAVVASYELATIATMMALAAVAHAGVAVLGARVRAAWTESATGLSIAATGIVVAVLGW